MPDPVYPGFKLTPGKLGFKLTDVLVGLKSGTTDTPEAIKTTEGRWHSLPYAWNPDTLSWEVATTRGVNGGAEVYVTNLIDTDQAIRLIVASNTVTYIGKAPPRTAESAASWKICRITSTPAGDLTSEYAAGHNVWTDYATLSYS